MKAYTDIEQSKKLAKTLPTIILDLVKYQKSTLKNQ